jgi:hypothetical protein
LRRKHLGFTFQSEKEIKISPTHALQVAYEWLACRQSPLNTRASSSSATSATPSTSTSPRGASAAAALGNAALERSSNLRPGGPVGPTVQRDQVYFRPRTSSAADVSESSAGAADRSAGQAAPAANRSTLLQLRRLSNSGSFSSQLRSDAAAAAAAAGSESECGEDDDKFGLLYTDCAHVLLEGD